MTSLLQALQLSFCATNSTYLWFCPSCDIHLKERVKAPFSRIRRYLAPSDFHWSLSWSALFLYLDSHQQLPFHLLKKDYYQASLHPGLPCALSPADSRPSVRPTSPWAWWWAETLRATSWWVGRLLEVGSEADQQIVAEKKGILLLLRCQYRTFLGNEAS